MDEFSTLNYDPRNQKYKSLFKKMVLCPGIYDTCSEKHAVFNNWITNCIGYDKF